MSDRFVPRTGGSLSQYDSFLNDALTTPFGSAPSFSSGSFAVQSGGVSSFRAGSFSPSTSPSGNVMGGSISSWPGYNQNWVIGGANGQVGGSTAVVGGVGNPATAAGGGFAMADRFNEQINQAARTYGVPANLVKAILVHESQGNWERDNYVNDYRGEQMLPFSGIFHSTADAWGLDWNKMIGNPTEQIAGIAKIMGGLAQKYGGFDNAIKAYFGGEQALTPEGFTDEGGLNSNQYYTETKGYWDHLDAVSGSDPTTRNSTFGGTNAVINKALEYVGKVPYVWGAVPGKGQDPSGGWDCSGFTYWLDQNYGDGSLAMGSHFQFQQAVDNHLLFTDTGQLQPGDLVFFDTGGREGGGAELNGASHVGMYIGNDQFVEAANPSVGTVVAKFSSYPYKFLGARHMKWSGGAAGSAPVSSAGGYTSSWGSNYTNPNLITGLQLPSWLR